MFIPWLLSEHVNAHYEFGNMLLLDSTLGIDNLMELEIKNAELRDSTNVLDSSDIALPVGFLTPRLVMPHNDFAPDYFTYSGYLFCSLRLCDALAQPAHVVQFAPVDLVAGGAQAYAQDYRLMRVLAQQPAMDLDRSECEVTIFPNRVTGEPIRYPSWIERIVLLEGLQPQTDIFRIQEAPTNILVTDAVAERGLRAGCTGVEFSDPSNPRFAMHIHRYRTLDGIAERRVHFPD